MKTYDILTILVEKAVKEKNKKKIEDLKIKIDTFLAFDRITFEEYTELSLKLNSVGEQETRE